MNAPTPIVGVVLGRPDEWNDFAQRHGDFLKTLWPPLRDAATQVLARRVESEQPHERIGFLLGQEVFEDFNEILVLCANGYGIAAIKLLRSMYERVVTMTYLLRNPESVQDFLDWHLLEKRKLLNLLKEEGDQPSKYFTAEDLANITAGAERARLRFRPNQRSWSGLDVRSMASRVGLDKLYVICYYWPTVHVHATAIGLTAGPQREVADRALCCAHTCLLLALLALEEQSRHFNLAVDFAALRAAHQRYWERDAPKG